MNLNYEKSFHEPRDAEQTNPYQLNGKPDNDIQLSNAMLKGE